MTTIGTLVAELGLETAAFHRDMGKAVSSLQSGAAQMNRSLANIERGFGMVSRAVIAIAGPAAIGAFIKSQADAGDQMNKTAQILGMSVEKLSQYQFAMKLANVDNDRFQQGMVSLGDKMQDAAIDKGGAAARTFRALGINVLDANGKLRSTDAVLEDVAKRFAESKDGIGKTNAAVAIFGQRIGPALIPALNGLQELTAEAERAGAVMSTDFARNAEQFNDNMTRMQTSAGMLARTISGPLIAALADLTERFNVATGAQSQLTLQTMERDRAALANEMVRLRERENSLGFTEPFVAAQKAKLFAEIDVLDALIIAENKRISNLNAAKSGGGAGGKGKDINLPLTPNVDQFGKLMEAMRKESAQAQMDILADEYAKTQARIKLAESEWRFKADAARLTKDQRIQFERELSQYLADKTAADLSKIAEEKAKKQEQAAADFDNLRRTFDSEYAAKEQQRIQIAELDAYYREFDLQQDESYYQLKKQIQDRGLSAMARRVAAANAARSEMWKAAFDGDLASIGGAMGEISGVMLSGSKKMFDIGKKAALSEAAISMYLSIENALATRPFVPVGLAMAAVAAAKGAANIAKIRSIQFGGGGGATPTFSASPSTGLPTGSSQAAIPPDTSSADGGGQTIVNVIVQGNVVGNEEYIDQLADGLRDRIDNRDFVLFGGRSRQAREIVEAV